MGAQYVVTLFRPLFPDSCGFPTIVRNFFFFTIVFVLRDVDDLDHDLDHDRFVRHVLRQVWEGVPKMSVSPLTVHTSPKQPTLRNTVS